MKSVLKGFFTIKVILFQFLLIHHVVVKAEAITDTSKYLIGQVDVLISAKPKATFQPMDCYVLVENIDKISDQTDEQSASKQSEIPQKVLVSSYLTLPHLDRNDGDENGVVWLSVEPRLANLIEIKDKDEIRLLYRFQDPTPAAKYKDLVLLLDGESNYFQFAVRYWHATHYDPVVCKDLIEQKSDQEINDFLAVFPAFLHADGSEVYSK